MPLSSFCQEKNGVFFFFFLININVKHALLVKYTFHDFFHEFPF